MKYMPINSRGTLRAKRRVLEREVERLEEEADELPSCSAHRRRVVDRLQRSRKELAAIQKEQERIEEAVGEDQAETKPTRNAFAVVNSARGTVDLTLEEEGGEGDPQFMPITHYWADVPQGYVHGD